MISNVGFGNGQRLTDVTAIKPNADLEAGHADDLSTAAATAHVSDGLLFQPFQPVCCNIVHMFMHQSPSLWLADRKARTADLSPAAAAACLCQQQPCSCLTECP